MLFKILILVILLAILISLGSGLFSLVRERSGSRKMLNALTLRISLSVLLFVLLMLAWYAGLIEPHGIGPQ